MSLYQKIFHIFTEQMNWNMIEITIRDYHFQSLFTNYFKKWVSVVKCLEKIMATETTLIESYQ